jgi:hypothetical protein
MMPVTMLGSDYTYSLSPYARGGSTLGIDYGALQRASDDWSRNYASRNASGQVLMPVSSSDNSIVKAAAANGVSPTDLYNYIMKIPLGTSTVQPSSQAKSIIDSVLRGIMTVKEALEAAKGLTQTDKKAVEDALAAKTDYTPWIIGGGAVLVALLFIVGTRR